MNVEALLQNFQGLGALVALGALEGAGGAAAAGRCRGHGALLAGNALPHCFVRAGHAERTAMRTRLLRGVNVTIFRAKRFKRCHEFRYLLLVAISLATLT